MSELPSGTVKLIPRDREQVDAVARLQCDYLSESVPARLGLQFLKSFYFSALVDAGLVICDLYRHEGRWAGQISYTGHPGSLVAAGARRRFPALCVATLRTLVTGPTRLRGIGEVLHKGRHLAPWCESRAGYFLGVAVAPEFRGVELPDGRRIGQVLVAGMVDYFRRSGFERVMGRVYRSNPAAIRFHKRCGFQVRPSPRLGDDEYELIYDLNA